MRWLNGLVLEKLNDVLKSIVKMAHYNLKLPVLLAHSFRFQSNLITVPVLETLIITQLTLTECCMLVKEESSDLRE